MAWVVGTPRGETALPSADTPASRITAYYFHTTARCSTCMKIETLAREAIEQSYADELASGTLKWKVVNIETPQNHHFVQDFKLITKSLVLVDEVDGKPRRWKNLEKIWELVWNPVDYKEYVRSEVASFMKGQ
jgi:hypothetical protein